jgi:hypothetical protein
VVGGKLGAAENRGTIIEAMFARRLRIERIDEAGGAHACPIVQLDNFAMRNFTNDRIFDDTLPVADGLMEAGTRVPVERLREAMEDWFWRKGYLGRAEGLRVREGKVVGSQGD